MPILLYTIMYKRKQTLTNSPDFKEKTVTSKNCLAMTRVHWYVTTIPLGYISCIECIIDHDEGLTLLSLLKSSFPRITSLFFLWLWCIVPCIQLQSFPASVVQHRMHPDAAIHAEMHRPAASPWYWVLMSCLEACCCKRHTFDLGFLLTCNVQA